MEREGPSPLLVVQPVRSGRVVVGVGWVGNDRGGCERLERRQAVRQVLRERSMRSLHELTTKRKKISGPTPKRGGAFLRVLNPRAPQFTVRIANKLTARAKHVPGISNHLESVCPNSAAPVSTAADAGSHGLLLHRTGQTVYAITTCTRRDRVYTPAKVRTARAIFLLHMCDDEPPLTPAESNSAISSSVITVQGACR